MLLNDILLYLKKAYKLTKKLCSIIEL